MENNNEKEIFRDINRAIKEYNDALRELSVIIREMNKTADMAKNKLNSLINGGYVMSALQHKAQHN